MSDELKAIKRMAEIDGELKAIEHFDILMRLELERLIAIRGELGTDRVILGVERDRLQHFLGNHSEN